MSMISVQRFVVLAGNALKEHRVLGTFTSLTDAEVFIAEQRIRQPGLAWESAPLYGVRQAGPIGAELLEHELTDQSPTQTPPETRDGEIP